MAWNIKERRKALGWSMMDLAVRAQVRPHDLLALETLDYASVPVSALACVLDALADEENDKPDDDLRGLAEWEA
jgi:ribosome-binding protein aMBF1 (putative translation factor)